MKANFFGNNIEVEIVNSANRHGIKNEDIISALNKSIFDETLQIDPNKTLIIGFDTKAQLLEIIVHVISDDNIIVFHAMPCRKIYLDKIKNERSFL